MKKLILIPIFAFVAFLAALFALTFPSVQRQIVMSATQGAFKEMSLEHISIGLSEVELSSLELVFEDDTRVSVSKLVGKYSLLKALKGHYEVNALGVDGLLVELAQKEEDEEEAEKEGKDEAKEAFEGILRPLREAGVTLALKDISVSGELRGHGMGATLFTLKSESPIASGQSGKLKLEASFPANDNAEAVMPRKAEGLLTLTLDSEGMLTELKTEINVHNAVSTYRLRAQALESPSGLAETYRVDLDYLTDSGMKQVLFYLGLEYRYADQFLSGIYKLSADQDVLNAFALTAEAVQPVNFSGEGSVSTQLAQGETRIEGKLRVNLPQPAKWDAALEEMGPMGLDLDLSTDLTKDSLSLNTLSGRLHSLEAPSLVNLKLLKPFTLPLGDGWEKYTLPSGSLIEMDMNVPLGALSAFTGGALKLKGSLEGKLNFRATADQAFIFDASSPLVLKVDQAVSDSEVMLESFVLRADPVVTYTEEKTQVVLKGVELESFGKPAGSAQVTFDIFTGDESYQEVTASQTIILDALFKQPVLKPHADYLPATPLTMHLDYQLSQNAERLQLHELESSVRGEDGTTYLLTRTSQSIEVPTQGERFAMEDYSGQMVEFEANNFPLSLVAPMVAGYDFSGVLNGKIRTSVSSGVLEIRASEPLSVSGLKLKAGKDQWLEKSTLKVLPEVDYSEKAWRVKLGGIDIQEDSKAVLAGNFEGEFSGKELPDALSANLKGDLARLLGPVGNVDRGMCELVLSFQGESPSVVELSLKLDGLKLKDSDHVLESLDSSFNGTLQLEPFTVSGTLPLKAQSKRAASDINVKLKVGKGYTHDEQHLTVRGKALAVEDVMMLGNLFNSKSEKTSGEETPSNEDEKGAGRDEKPFWSDFGGKIDIQVERIIYGNWDVQALNGAAQIDEENLNISKLTANLMGAPFSAMGRVDFDAQRAKAYQYEGKVDVQQLSLGKAFDIKGWIDGLFTISADSRSMGDNLDELLNHMMGSLKMTSDKGTLYFFEQGSGVLGSVSGLLNQTGSLLGELTGKVLPFDTQFLGSLTGFMQKLSFFNFDVAINRGENLDLIFERIRVDGEMMSISGVGKVDHKNGVSLANQPLNMQLQLGAKGALAGLLSKIGLMGQATDAKGYQQAYTFPVGGTLGSAKFDIMDPVKGALTSFLPGGGSRQQNSGETRKKSDAEEIVDGVLKGLF